MPLRHTSKSLCAHSCPRQTKAEGWTTVCSRSYSVSSSQSTAIWFITVKCNGWVVQICLHGFIHCGKKSGTSWGETCHWAQWWQFPQWPGLHGGHHQAHVRAKHQAEGPNRLIKSLLSNVESFEVKLRLWQGQLEKGNTVHFRTLQEQKPDVTSEYASECAKLIHAGEVSSCEEYPKGTGHVRYAV